MTPQCQRHDHDACPYSEDSDHFMFCECICHDDDNGWSDYGPPAYYEPGLGEDRERTPK